MGWKIAQTLMEWSAGIASAEHDIRAAAQVVAPGITIACTRKTVPLTRALFVKAVLAGGGAMHRTGLGDTLLVFPEHRVFFPGEPLAATLARLRASTPERAIVVEVADADDAVLASQSVADVVQLEKFTPDAVAKLRSRLAEAGVPTAKLAAAGGINAANAGVYAAAGADIIVTSAPYSARPRDVQVRISPAKPAAFCACIDKSAQQKDYSSEQRNIFISHDGEGRHGLCGGGDRGTILAVAKEHKIPIPFDCQDGECGSCLVEVSHFNPEQKCASR